MANIVIIEDEPLVALTIQEMLEDAGFEVLGVANTLVAALAFIKELSFDAAIVDGNLRGVSSDPAIGALIERGLPYIVCSGYSAEVQAGARGAAPFIAKPFTQERLIRALQSVLPPR